jgi:hypothetical protein
MDDPGYRWQGPVLELRAHMQIKLQQRMLLPGGYDSTMKSNTNVAHRVVRLQKLGFSRWKFWRLRFFKRLVVEPVNSFSQNRLNF